MNGDELVRRADRALRDHDGLSLVDRVSLATCIVTGGDVEKRITFGEIARVAEVSIEDAVMAYESLAERHGAPGPASTERTDRK